MKKLLAPAIAVLCLASSAMAQETVIEGRLVGQGGAPMRAAHVQVVPPDRASAPVASAEVGADGRFTLPLDTTGAFRIAFLGVHHDRVVRPLFVETPGTVRMRVQLAPYRPAENFSGLRITGDFDDFIRNLSRPLREQPDGSYAATVEAPGDSVAYQVLGAVKGRQGRLGIAGTQADAYRPGEQGAYRSVIEAPGDSVRLAFDPSQLPLSEGRLATVRIENAEANAPARATAALVGTSSLNARLARKTNRLQQRFRQQARAGALDDPRAAFQAMQSRIDSIRASFELSGAAESLKKRLATSSDPSMRRVLLAAYFGLPDVGQEKDPARAAQAMEAIPPASGLWALQGGTLGQMLDAVPAADSAAVRAYTDAVVERNPHRSVRGEVLVRRLREAQALRDVKRARVLYDQIQQRAQGTAAVVQASNIMREMAREQQRRSRRIRAGRSVPPFTLTSFDDSTRTFSRESLRGRTYLIDFWAVWCGPCVQEMPNLRRVYDEYKNQGFTILSVSLDDRRADVRAFRRERHAMPWKHAFLGDDVRAAITRRFEVSSIPRPILVGKDGEILATQDALRGPNLGRTLEKVLGEGGTEAPSAGQ